VQDTRQMSDHTRAVKKKSESIPKFILRRKIVTSDGGQTLQANRITKFQIVPPP